MAEYPTGNVKLASQMETMQDTTTFVSAPITAKQHHCKLCDQLFGTKGALRTHSKTSARHRELFGCKFCDIGLIDQNALNSHLSTKHAFKNPKETASHVNVSMMLQNSLVSGRPEVKAVPKLAASIPEPGKPVAMSDTRLPRGMTMCRTCDVLINKDWLDHKNSQTHFDSCKRKGLDCNRTFSETIRFEHRLRKSDTHKPTLPKAAESRPHLHENGIHDSMLPISAESWPHLCDSGAHKMMSAEPAQPRPWNGSTTSRHKPRLILTDRWITLTDVPSNETSSQMTFRTEFQTHSRDTTKHRKYARNTVIAPPRGGYCRLCDTEYSDNWEAHKKTHKNGAEDGQLYCEDCQQAFKNEKSLQHHHLRMHDLTVTTKTPVKSGQLNLRRGSFYGI